MKNTARFLVLLLALVLCLGCAACGAPAPAVTDPPLPAPTEVPEAQEPAEEPVSLPGLSWPVERAEGPTSVSYPYIVRTENAVWHLSADDMELLGQEAYCEGLERILQDQEADFAEARALLAPWLWEEIPPIDIYTDFCGHAEGDEIYGAYYRGRYRDIRLYHDWEMAGRSLLHEYVHYLTFTCTDRPVSEGFFCEGVADYVSNFACRNRMIRTAALNSQSEAVAQMGQYNLLDEDGAVDPARLYLFNAEFIRSDAALGSVYNNLTGSVMTREERINQNPSPTTISYYEAGSMIAYLVENYGEELVFGHWDADPFDLAAVFGKDFSELYWDWTAWNLAKCEELGIILDFG